MTTPRVVIAGVQSGVGKTSLTLGIAAALVRRGLAVQAFKVGPDYLDPTYLAVATGRPCYNLDPWMTGREYPRRLLARAGAGADLCLIEGVMGLYDGADAGSAVGSTADLARLLGAPVVLVADAHGAARSLAAVVKGFAEFPDAPHLGGVVCNRAGSDRHRGILADALGSVGLGHLLLGAVARGAVPELRSRHLGLTTATPRELSAETLGALADACEAALDLDRLLALAQRADPLPVLPEAPAPPRVRARLGIAQDEAFHFYYPDNLDALAAAGVELVPFSPLADRALPPDLDGLYLGGGYPEEHGEALAQNAPLREAVGAFAASGRLVYAECGGLMYLGRELADREGRRYPMAGVLPIATRMLARRRALGYAEAETVAEGPWGPAGTRLRGHEFHYSEVEAKGPGPDGWGPAYRRRRRREAEAAPEGYARGRVLASYLHLHFASNPPALAGFLGALGGEWTESLERGRRADAGPVPPTDDPARARGDRDLGGAQDG